MGLMDRDYYREKKPESKGKEIIRWVKENPITALIIGLVVLGLLFFLV